MKQYLDSINWVHRGQSLESAKSRQVPVLVCVHGFMGGPEDFANLIPFWENKYCIIIPDFLYKYRTHGIIDTQHPDFADELYQNSAGHIAAYLEEMLPEVSVFFFGVSLGGKIIYDFNAKYPVKFQGAVITDMGPGKLEFADLYQFLTTTLPSLNLNLEWPELRKELIEKIPNKNVRVLLQTQIYYPNKVPPAVFRPGLTGLENLIARTALNDQVPLMPQLKGPIIILKATELTAIDPSVLKLMEASPIFEIRWIQNATHFLHFTHLEDVKNAVLDIESLE